MMQEPRGSDKFEGLIWMCVSDFEKQDNAPSWQGSKHYDRNYINIMYIYIYIYIYTYLHIT